MEKNYDFILTNLAVGNYEARTDPRFHAVLTLISPSGYKEIEKKAPTKAKHTMHIPIYDGELGIGPYLDDGYDFIDKHIKEGEVLVHCRAGISRSPTMATYYIARNKNISAITALSIVRMNREIVDPYPGFIMEVSTKLRDRKAL